MKINYMSSNYGYHSNGRKTLKCLQVTSLKAEVRDADPGEKEHLENLADRGVRTTRDIERLIVCNV